MLGLRNQPQRGGDGCPKRELTEIEGALTSTIAQAGVNALGLNTGQSERLRVITPHRLFLAIVGAFASARVESLADLQREFNHQNGTRTRYKAFYNRLARPSFPEFMRHMLGRLLSGLALKTLEPEETSALSTFEDIIIHDGSSFALKSVLSVVFPGRFTTRRARCRRASCHVQRIRGQRHGGDAGARHRGGAALPLPDAAELQGKLLLGGADRGYPAVPYFEALGRPRRIVSSFGFRDLLIPWVRVAYEKTRAHPLKKPIRLSQFLSQHQGYCLDLDVEFEGSREGQIFRLLILPGREAAMTRLCTNLRRRRFSFQIVAKLYRFPLGRSSSASKNGSPYANLHAFDTGAMSTSRQA